MLLLSTDTSTDIITLAILRDKELLAEVSINAGKRHSERLVPLINILLDEVRLSIDDINLLAISLGPGSFTGLRVGLATWKGLAISKDLPIIGVPTLDAMTRLAPFDNAIVCPILDARMKEVFAGIYQFQNKKRETLQENFLGNIQEFLSLLKQYAENLPIILFGEGALLYQQSILETFPYAILGEPWWSHPRASSVGIEALHLQEHGYKKEIDEILPIYLRLSQPEERKRKCQNPSI